MYGVSTLILIGAMSSYERCKLKGVGMRIASITPSSTLSSANLTLLSAALVIFARR
jgi:hypothetical protein